MLFRHITTAPYQSLIPSMLMAPLYHGTWYPTLKQVGFSHQVNDHDATHLLHIFIILLGYVLPFNAVKEETENRRWRVSGYSDKTEVPHLQVRFIAYHPSHHYVAFVFEVKTKII